jgi:hypothetical protein
MSFVERTLMIQKYIQYLRLIGLGKGRIFLHILIHEELSQTCPVYQKLYESQAEWYR